MRRTTTQPCPVGRPPRWVSFWPGSAAQARSYRLPRRTGGGSPAAAGSGCTRRRQARPPPRLGHQPEKRVNPVPDLGTVAGRNGTGRRHGKPAGEHGLAVEDQPLGGRQQRVRPVDGGREGMGRCAAVGRLPVSGRVNPSMSVKMNVTIPGGVPMPTVSHAASRRARNACPWPAGGEQDSALSDTASRGVRPKDNGRRLLVPCKTTCLGSRLPSFCQRLWPAAGRRGRG
jgi:hypothetical protein